MLETFIFSFGPVLFGLAGLILALYIYTTKLNKAKILVCPIGGHCDAVVNSKYSKFLGIPVELMGVIYYLFIICSYSLVFFFPNIFSEETLFFLTSFSVVAFFFSLYLVFIQAFTLKNWCTWCLFSAGFTTFIAVTAVFGAKIDLILLFAEYKSLIVFFHAFAAAIGVGATSVTDILFFKFIKDFKISKGEKNIMDTMSHIIWIALAVLIITGIGLYAPQTAELAESSKFLVKVIIIGVIVFNGIILNLVVSPRLTKLSFREKKQDLSGEPRLYRKLAFATGAVSIVSWYSVFVLGSVRSIPVDFRTGLLFYLVLVALTVIGSQFYDTYLVWRQSKQSQIISEDKNKNEAL